ncbi:N-acetyl-gamma-glutamyl-phosphate reductase [Desulfitispora alkaliphila]|uniref:N-acetyl-gamma-glutamyl-phosphate reductase n=1 Tax=Desulfitispora alkaliphila TaxID=622674 RepID=UPI003D1F3C08
MIKVGVVGATGYTGIELIRILLHHSNVELVAATSRSYSGQRLDRVFPSLSGQTDLVCEPQNIEEVAEKADVVFICLPHGLSANVVEAVISKGKWAIDLGADFRLGSGEIYREWYQSEPPVSNLLKQAVYGLPELYRDKIKTAKLIANPGCYPTSAILALAPVVEHNLIKMDGLVIDAKSGVSGAGRSLSLGSQFAEVNESFKAYKIASHRHTPEIEQELSGLANSEIKVVFTPHLVPMNRGILATTYAVLNESSNIEQIGEVFKEYYKEEKFVQVLPEGINPQTNWVSGTNNCQISITVDQRTNRLIVVSAIDNLIKGAAGQAVQNMNIMMGLPEDQGLNMISRYL